MRRPKSRPRQTHDAPHADQLREALARVAKGRTGREPSPLRIHVAAVFDRLEADRERGAAWDGLAEPFAALGILTAEGKAPTGLDLKNAFHAERYSREPKRPRAPKAKAASAPVPQHSAPASAPAPPSPKPEPLPKAPVGNPASPYAEMERRVAEKKLRQEKIARAKDWNPYAVPQSKDQTDE